MHNQITTVTLFESKGVRNQFWAFSQVPLALFRLKDVPGLQFYKSMGSGGGKGFDFTPSFSTYCWLLVWENEDYANRFFNSNAYFLRYHTKAVGVKTLYLENVEAHGLWSGVKPFEKSADFKTDSKVVVLTRARIKTFKLIHFWTKVGRTAKELYKFAELEFAIGVGELPFIQQATLSIWKNPQAMKEYAYKDETHKNVIKLTRKHKWYSEELFARFVLKQAIVQKGLG